MKRIIITIFINVLPLMIWGQSQEDKIIKQYFDFGYNNPSETALLSIGRTLFFSGEEIPFSCLLLDQYLEPGNTYSKVLHISLVGDNDFQMNYSYDSKNGNVISTFPLPEDIPTGNYQLIAHTKFMENGDFQKLSHRIPIYVQNHSEKSVPAVKSIINKDLATSPSIQSQEISLIDHKDYLEIKIDSEKGDYFLLSEGFHNIQFIAKISIKGKSKSLSISKDKLKGQFQRLVLIDETLNAVACHNYFLKETKPLSDFNSDKATMSVMSSEEFKTNNENILFRTVSVNRDEFFKSDSKASFKRIFKSYFDIPGGLFLNERSIKELTSKDFLKRTSIYSLKKWNDILDSKKTEVLIAPEKRIVVKGEILGENISLDGFVRVHLFKNNLDVATPLNGRNTFTISLLAPFGEDVLYATIYDENGNKISANDSQIIIEKKKIDYLSSISYHEQSITDSIISEKMELKYIISTFDGIDQKSDFFWENKAIDESYSIDDYRSLADVREFIVEALPKTTIRKAKDGGNTLMMYSADQNRLFDNAPLMIIDNKIIDDAEEILTLNLDSIDQIKQVYKLETLEKFSLSFNDGVFIVVTKEGNRVNKDLTGKPFSKFYGYGLSNKSELTDSFDETLLIDLIIKNEKSVQLKSGRDFGNYNLVSEYFTKDGSYKSESKTISIEKQ